MLSHADNELLCRVEGDAPMGAVMRRYWLPACLSEEVPEPMSPPVRTRLLGQSFVVYRDLSGAVAAMDWRCPHRGAALDLARCESDGLRCIYHGWKLSMDGRVLDTPSEPPRSRVKDSIQHPVYPTEERCGVIWVYLGEGTPPALPDLWWMDLPESRWYVRKTVLHANFVQSIEGGIDSAHSDFLHSSETMSTAAAEASASATYDRVVSSGRRSRPSTDTAPLMKVRDTPTGFVYAAIREAAGDAEKRYVRVTPFVAPFYCLIPETYFHGSVPLDDGWTAFYLWYYERDRDLPRQHIEAVDTFLGLRPGVDLTADYRRPGSPDNHWLQDRDAMASGSSFAGVPGTTTQDAMVQESMGPIQDRTVEHLGTSDRAITHMRQLLLRWARAEESGEPAAPLPTAEDYQAVRGAAGLVRSDADDPFEELGLGDGQPVA